MDETEQNENLTNDGSNMDVAGGSKKPDDEPVDEAQAIAAQFGVMGDMRMTSFDPNGSMHMQGIPPPMGGDPMMMMMNMMQQQGPPGRGLDAVKPGMNVCIIITMII